MQTLSYKTLLETSRALNWRIDDITGEDKRFDFSKPFLPETFARTDGLPFLGAHEKLLLNHVRSRGYMAMFELVEEFVVPFVVEEAASDPEGEPFRAAALAQFASEELKHMELFRRRITEVDEKFGFACALIGPTDDIRRAILAHHPLGVAITTLALEWMSQAHFTESVKDDGALDPQFRSLLRHHWVEECQHARLDGLMLPEMVKRVSPGEVDKAIEDYFKIVALFDGAFGQQANFDLDAFERARGSALDRERRATFLEVQHQALRWTFLGSAMQNRNFLAVIGSLRSDLPARILQAATRYC
jgi:hypothetical protein